MQLPLGPSSQPRMGQVLAGSMTSSPQNSESEESSEEEYKGAFRRGATNVVQQRADKVVTMAEAASVAAAKAAGVAKAKATEAARLAEEATDIMLEIKDKDKERDREGLFGRFKRQPESPVVIVSSRPTLQALVGPTGTRGGPSASDGMVREAFRSGDSDGSFAFDRDPRNATAFGRNTAGVGAGGSAGPSSPPSPSPFSPAPGGDVETGDGPSPVSAISALLKSADTYR